MKKIGIIHLNQIGDLVFSLPVLKALRDNFPGAEIDSIIRPHLAELMDGSRLADNLILRRDGLANKIRLINTVRQNRYDLLISLARSQEALILTCLSRAGIKAGFAHPPWDMGLDVREVVEGHNCWYNNAKLLHRLKVPVNKDDYVGLLKNNDSYYVPEIPGRYVVISPGASKRRQIKAWDEDKFAGLITWLESEYSLVPVLVGGKDCIEYNELIINCIDDKDMAIVNMTGKIGLKNLVSLLREASLFVGIDSGVMHMASSLDIPVVGLFGPTDPFYVGPQNERSIVVKSDMDCMPCYLRPSCNNIECMRNLGIEEVKQACRKVMCQTESGYDL